MKVMGYMRSFDLPFTEVVSSADRKMPEVSAVTATCLTVLKKCTQSHPHAPSTQLANRCVGQQAHGADEALGKTAGLQSPR